MSLHHRLLEAAYYPCKLANAIGQPLGLRSPDRLRVLLYHDVAPQDVANFAAQLRWLARAWDFVSAEQFTAMVSGEEPIRGRSLLLTFDDGFASNREVAERVLNPMGIRAVFFAVSDLLDLTDGDEVRRFMAERIYLGSRPEQLPRHWSNMRWTDLEALLEQGHSVGGHTRTHTRLSTIAAESDLEGEIVASADALEERLGVPIEHFAFPFGDVDSFSEKALAISRRRFRCVYSGQRGDNASGNSPFAARRDGSATQDGQFNYVMFSNALLGAFLEGAADPWYVGARARLDAWAGATS